ncbi:MAG: HlyD family secretion protein [Pirellulales bacterium]
MVASVATPAESVQKGTPAPTPLQTSTSSSTSVVPLAPAVEKPPRSKKRRWPWLLAAALLLLLALKAVPWLHLVWTTVSTDDAYVNGHVTFTAPRVPGQVVKVLVDDNYRVRRGDLLVQLDKEPYQVQVDIARASVEAAEADLIVARAEARGIEGQMRSLRFGLQRSIEDVHNQVALLHARVATLNAQKATVAKAQADYNRGKPLLATGAMSQEDFDLRNASMLTAQAGVDEALQAIYQVRVSLGLPPVPASGDELTQVPADLDETFSAVKQAQANLIEAAARLGVSTSFRDSPPQMIADFVRRDPQGNLDHIYDDLLKNAPGVKQAESRLMQAKRNLDQADLNLRYCDVYAEIDGVVTRRNVNVGNNVTAGQSLLAVRSLREIWIDANFKETQLRNLRIGQRAELEVDMYGSRRTFQGRITGFTMGTGSTLALLPPENATGNFVKVVQRLPVRIELTDYDPDAATLFVGLSVTPYVHVNEPPTGPDAGKLLQAFTAAGSTNSTTSSTTEPKP